MSKTAKANETEKAAQELQTYNGKSVMAPEKAVTYTIKELINASEKALDVPRECAAAAFKFQKAEKLTLLEAKNIVERFMKKEVK